jgi:hypothetical protein
MKRIAPLLIAAAVMALGFVVVRSCNAQDLRVRWIDGTEVDATVRYDTGARLVLIDEAPLFADGFEG